MLASLFTNSAVSYSYTTTTTSSSTSGGDFTLFLVFFLAVLALAVVAIVGLWKVFTKAGKPGWAAIVPLYNSWVLAEIAGKPGWWGLYPLIAWIPFVGWIGVIVISIILSVNVAHNFGKSTAFGVVGLWLFSFIGYLILGFGDAKYQGPTPAAPAAGDPPYPPVAAGPTATPPAAPPAAPVQ